MSGLSSFCGVGHSMRIVTYMAAEAHELFQGVCSMLERQLASG